MNQGAAMILKALVQGSERLDGKGEIANWRLWQVWCGVGLGPPVLYTGVHCALHHHHGVGRDR